MDIRFGDHASFHRAAIGMTASSAVLGIVLHPLTPLAPLLGGIFGIAVGAALGYGKPAWRLIAAALASVPLFLMAASWPAFALCAGILALGCTLPGAQGREGLQGLQGLRGFRGAATVMLGATLTLLAMWTALRFDDARATAHWPAAVTDGAAAAAMGIVGVIAMLPRHLGIAFDPVLGAVRALPPKLDGEVRALCDRTLAIWSDVKTKLGEGDSNLTLVRDGVLKTLEVAAKSTDAQPQGANDEQLGRRMEDLDARIAAATDDEVKAQYRSARAALSDQATYRERIRQNHERLVARMHHHVAALEKFQLAAGGLASARAAATGAALPGLGQQLSDLSRDVAASGEALVEVGEA
ncbi:MAG: hypothetical protein ABI467_13870 [Kofleriaceae bacterium]